MDQNERQIKNIVSFFSESKKTEVFKKIFLDELKDNENYQMKLKQMLEVNDKPNDETFWKRVLETQEDLLSQEIKEKIFQKFEEFLHEIFPKGRLE